MAQFRIKRQPDGSWDVVGFKYHGKQLDQIARQTAKNKESLATAAENVAESLNPKKEATDNV